ncbi:unnamed protein product [Ascophyllum nodosum]
MVQMTGEMLEGNYAASGKVATIFLSLGSFAIFFEFAKLYFRRRLFPYHSLSPEMAKGSSPRSNFDGGTLSLGGACWAFSGTFALSCCIFELLVLEVAGLLNPKSSALVWRVCLILMTLSLHLVLPFMLAYACLGEIGFGKRTSCAGALVLLSMALCSAFTLGSQGGMSKTMTATDIGATQALGGAREAFEGLWSIFSLEAGLARMGVVGVASLALLSGFGAVNLPYQQLATLLRRVPTSLVESRERQARLTLADIGDRKRRAVIAKATTAAFGSNCNGESITGGPRVDRFHGRGILTRLMGMVALTATGDPSQQATETETANLEQIARELFVEIADCRRIQEQQRRARSFTGGVLVGFGVVMFIYCILRLWKAGVSVLWASYAYRSTVGDAAGVSRGAGMADDPASRLVHFALSRHLLDNGDADGWSELISFFLTGVLVLLQTRGFLVTITRLSKSSMIREFSIPAQIMSVLISMLMGTYFTSSVILMRVNLPPRHRVSITAVLGGMKFSFYQRWFDTVFFLSGCASAVTLLVLHLANRNSDADHHDHRHTAANRVGSDAFLSTGVESSVHKGDRPGMNNRGAQSSVVRVRPRGSPLEAPTLPAHGRVDRPSSRRGYRAIARMAESRKLSAKQS